MKKDMINEAMRYMGESEEEFSMLYDMVYDDIPESIQDSNGINWVISKTPESGTIHYTSPEREGYVVNGTPYWEDTDFVRIEVTEEGMGDVLWSKEYQLPSEYDLDSVIDTISDALGEVSTALETDSLVDDIPSRDVPKWTSGEEAEEI